MQSKSAKLEIMETNNTPSSWFVFYGDKLLLEKKNEKYTIPFQPAPPLLLAHQTTVHKIASLDEKSSFTYAIHESIEESDKYVMIGLRASYDYLGEPLYNAAGKAYEILHWDENSQFCPACGTKTIQTTAISKQCPKCERELYPSISTAILVLVCKGDSILLVHARNFKGTFKGLVAGFLETGETLEECVAREVLEETGLSIKNITYFGNQAWPYPSGLMVGFIADYESGEINLQDEELSSAAFYTKDNLPELPRKLSLARKMIDWWMEQ